MRPTKRFRLLCPHCGNRTSFEIEVTASTDIHIYEDGAVDMDEIYYRDLPFNSRVLCRKCGKRGRWCNWMRGAYQDMGDYEVKPPPVEADNTTVQCDADVPQRCFVCGGPLGDGAIRHPLGGDPMFCSEECFDFHVQSK